MSGRVVNIRDLGRMGTWPKDVRRIDRRSPYGNPFRVDGDLATWLAVAVGERGDADGRRRGAVKLYRWWMTGGPFPIATVEPPGGGEVEYSDGSVRTVRDLLSGFALLAASKYSPIELPPKPDLEPLRGFRLACWCAPLPCHGDVIAELIP